MFIPKTFVLLYALVLIVWSKMALVFAVVRVPLQRAYRNSCTLVRMLKKLDGAKPPCRFAHGAAHEIQKLPQEGDTRVFKRDEIDDAFWRFANFGPAFSVSPDLITFLKEPTDFYNELLAGIDRARHRIVLASLYIGSSSMEKELISKLHKALERNQSLSVTILLDHMRARRGGRVPVEGEKKEAALSSLELIMPLVKRFPDRVTFMIYHTPDLRGLMKKVVPNLYNEAMGVSHIKAYIFDEDVVMSGANLSYDYFTNRQDRYYKINRHPSLTNYFHDLIKEIGSFSHLVSASGEIVLANKDMDSDIDHIKLRRHAQQRLQPFLQPRTFYTTNSKIPVHKLGKHLPDMDVLVQKKTWIFPSFQLAPFYIRQDEALTDSILSSDHSLYLSSPYLNLTRNYTRQLLDGKNQVDILTASPQANGWFKATGMARFISPVYTRVAQTFFKRVQRAGQLERVRLHEYIRPGWTFHSKGVWAMLPGQQLPYMTTIGSSNLSGRSTEKDLEAQLVILTEDDGLMKKFEEERAYMFQDSDKLGTSILERPVPLIARVAADIATSFI